MAEGIVAGEGICRICKAPKADHYDDEGEYLDCSEIAPLVTRTCHGCDGEGYVRTGIEFGVARCLACRGTGTVAW